MAEATQKASITKGKETGIVTKYSISYIRVSTKKQTKSSTSGVVRQEDLYGVFQKFHPEYKSLNRTSQVQMYRQQWADKKLFNNYPTDGIVVKINSRKLQLIRKKSVGVYPHWAMAC